ncbi:MAG: PAS domain S-box protein [Rhodanobacteraceae bacterium]
MNKEGGSDAGGAYASLLEREESERHSFLLQLTDALRPLRHAQAIRAESARRLGVELAVDRAFYAEVDEQGQAFFAFDYCNDGVQAVAGRYRLDDFGTVAAAVLRAGRIACMADVEADDRFSEAEKQRCREFALRAFVKVPLVKDGRLVAFFALHQARPRAWTDDEIMLTTEVAECTWAMIERAKAETALRISDEKYRSLFDTIDEGVCISEVISAEDGSVTGLRYLEVNPAFERHTGLRDVVGKTTGDVLPNLERHWLDAITRVMRTSEPVRVMNYLADLDRWYDLQHSRVGGAGSTLLATVFTDISGRRKADLANSRLAAIIESSDDAIIRKNLDGIIETWNAGAERMFGYTEPEVIGKPVTILMPPDRVDEEPGILARLRRGERVDHYETIRRRKDGSLIDVSLTVSPIVDSEGRVVAASKIARDITQRKRVDALLHEREQRQTFLLGLSDALRGENDPDAIAHLALERIARQLGLDRAYIGRGHAGEELAVIGPEVRRDDLEPIAGSVHTSDFPEVDCQFRQGTLAIDDIARELSLSERERSAFAAIDLAGLVCVGIRKGERGLTWALVAGSARPRAWTPGEIALLEEVAERTWTAVERAHVDAALRASEHRYRTLFDAIGDGFCTIEVLFDEEGKPFDYRFLSANAAFERQTGLRDVLGRRIKALVPDHEANWFEIYGRIVRTGQPEYFEQRADALGRWYEVFAFPLGPPHQLGVLFKDVASRRQAEAAWRESDRRHGFLLMLSDALREQPDAPSIGAVCVRMLAEHLDVDRCYITNLLREYDRARVAAEYRRDGIAPIDGETGEAALSDFPVAASRLETDALVVTDLANDLTFGEAERASILALGGMQAIVAAPLREGERNYVWALVVGSAAPRVWTREEVHLVEDVAERAWTAIERAETETALREREAELQRVSRAKDEFIAMLSHELRNPLAPIATTLELMKLRAPDALVRERGIIEDQVRHLTGLVDDLLDVARITSGKVELEADDLDIREVVDAAVETTQTTMEAQRQSLHVQVEDGLVVWGDRRRLVQVLVNLLVNAAKYSPPDRNVWLSASRDNGEVVLRVRDQGQGIPAGLLSRIFESFTQGTQALDRSRGGLGLGLAIVRNLVTLHGGSVGAASDGPYKGSEFVVRLPWLQRGPPRVPEAQPEPAATEVFDRDAERIKVLIVDDYAPAADSLAMLLQEMGYHTHVVNDGAAALQAVKTFEPQVALVDIGLPVIDGYEVAQTVRRMPGREGLPLIAVTGYGQPADRARVAEAGFNEHLVKPLDASRISELIERMVATT